MKLQEGELVEEAVRRALRPALSVCTTPDKTQRKRWVLVGDPQAPLRRMLSIFARCGLLNENGTLHESVGLLCVGDYFDFRTKDRARAGLDGELLLRWFAAHPPNQVVLLLGNHDLARVMEFSEETDASFLRARSMADTLLQETQRDPSSARLPALRASFAEEFSHFPSPGIVARDFHTFSVSQRMLVQQLLLSKRIALAAVGVVHGTEALLTHAGVTKRELAALSLDEDCSVGDVASGLNLVLERAITAVAPAWLSNFHKALDLRPFHAAGTGAGEGGGLLYHRPANPAVEESELDRLWAWGPSDAPRRFDPRSLPMGMLQVCGHTGHHKARKELGAWVRGSWARSLHRGGLRTLSSDGTNVRYELELRPHDPLQATMYMIDPEFNETNEPNGPLVEDCGEVFVP